ncbi:MAG: hypothetical protein U0984_15975 [Prosthecobacter sp.]|nr:hypothetical protein [Prosthecobacter sp.]
MPLLLHTCITWLLTGLIWHVQLVRYPHFHQVQRDRFTDHHFGHCLRISLQVLPLLFAEALTAAWLLYLGEHRPLFIASLALMVLNWLSTALFQAPLHTRLLRGYNATLIRHLILTNWLRTLGWTTRAILVAWLIAS